jgi:hypothetical protein
MYAFSGRDFGTSFRDGASLGFFVNFIEQRRWFSHANSYP